MGTTVRRSSVGSWMDKSTEMGMFICSSTTRIFLVGTRGWHENGRKKAEHGSTKCLYLAVGRPDILWSVNKLARAIKKWTRVCDRRLVRLISYIHHTSPDNIVIWETRLSLSMRFVSKLRFCWRP